DALLTVKRVSVAGKPVVKAVHQRVVSLADIDERLAGVVAVAAEPVLLGRSGQRAAVLGALPDVGVTVDEVSAFVSMLVEHDRIGFGTKAYRGARAPASVPARPTHVVRKLGDKKVLTRVRYACRPPC
ncbi:MAG: hypothetical protein JSV80_12740, partial [Acidobacteriota bacterium]